MNKINKNFKNIWIILGAVSIFTMVIIFNKNCNVNKETQIEAFTIKNHDKKFVYPMGNIIGVKANTDGVLVLGYEDEDIDYIGGIQIGDNIVKIDNKRIKNSQDVSEILNKIKKNKVEVTFERKNKYKTEVIETKKENGKYKLGLWVRDKISGIGTMTFYDPSMEKFKAIGHAIKDSDTNELLKIKQGYIYKPEQLKIVKASNEKVGKIKGDFNDSNLMGNFSNNSELGISGNIIENHNKEFNVANKEKQLIEVGRPQDVKIGDAVILFEDKNKNITSYDIKIESIVYDKGNYRDMVIKVVDDKLLEYTGGIVQGMSGAPIIQNNKIIGAITHVFRDNPKKGYGIFIDEMIKL
ncbi:stage IV sporulation protein B, peptidase S55 family [Clostridioides difficile]|nr:stage IV sporulation protein B, peptidase S55 family [Clostridioides difficile]HBG4727010.1 peptidase S55 [Clostridioides difficile]